MAKRWTPEDDDYLRYWYGSVGIHPDMLARDLGRSEAATGARIRHLALYPPIEGLAVGETRRRRPPLALVVA